MKTTNDPHEFDSGCNGLQLFHYILLHSNNERTIEDILAHDPEQAEYLLRNYIEDHNAEKFNYLNGLQIMASFPLFRVI